MPIHFPFFHLRCDHGPTLPLSFHNIYGHFNMQVVITQLGLRYFSEWRTIPLHGLPHIPPWRQQLCLFSRTSVHKRSPQLAQNGTTTPSHVIPSVYVCSTTRLDDHDSAEFRLNTTSVHRTEIPAVHHLRTFVWSLRAVIGRLRMRIDIHAAVVTAKLCSSWRDTFILI